MADDLADLRVVLATDSVDFFDQLAALLHEPRVQSVVLLEVFEILHRDADVQVVRTRRQDVLAGPRRLVGDDRLDAGVEERGLQSRQHRVERLAARPGNRRSILHGSLRGSSKGLRSALEDELARGQVVVWSRVDPEELRVALDFSQHRSVDALRVRQDFLEDVAHLEVVHVALVVIDVAACERGLIQVPDELLLFERELLEAVGVHLHDRCIVHPLEEILPLRDGRCGGRARRGWRRCVLATSRTLLSMPTPSLLQSNGEPVFAASRHCRPASRLRRLPEIPRYDSVTVSP